MTNAPKKIICRNPVKFLSLVKNSLRKSSNHQHKTRMRTTQTHTRLAQHPPATPPPPPLPPRRQRKAGKQVSSTKSQWPTSGRNIRFCCASRSSSRSDTIADSRRRRRSHEAFRESFLVPDRRRRCGERLSFSLSQVGRSLAVVVVVKNCNQSSPPGVDLLQNSLLYYS